MSQTPWEDYQEDIAREYEDSLTYTQWKQEERAIEHSMEQEALDSPDPFEPE